MKMGILFTIYNCENYVDDCLKPWFNLKKNMILPWHVQVVCLNLIWN
jgi:hypothetical protein